MGQTPQIHIRINGTALKTDSLCQQASIFCNHIMSGKDQILRGFSFPGTGINISCYQPCTGCSYQAFPIAVLQYRLIGGGKINQYFSPTTGQFCGRRVSYPQVFANFTAYHQFLLFLCLKKNSRTKGDAITKGGYHIHFRLPRCEVPGFVEFSVIGNVSLRNQGQHSSPV